MVALSKSIEIALEGNISFNINQVIKYTTVVLKKGRFRSSLVSR